LTTTTNLGLTTYSSESGSLTSFLDYRLATAGTTTSNLITLDRWAGETSGSVNSLKTHAVYTASGTEVSSNYYVSTVAGVSSYTTNLVINLKLNTSITGSATINLNSLGDVVLKKVNSSGNIVNLATGDIILNQYYIFVFNGTNFVMVSGGTSSGSSGGTTYGGITPIVVSGSQISHATTAVSAGNYLSANITVDATGHITSASSGVSASSVGAPSDSPFITSGSTPSLTNYSILTAGSNISISSASISGGNIIIHSTATSTTYAGSALITVSGSKISHIVSSITTGSYNAIDVDAYGHITGGSNISYSSSIAGSGIMSDSGGSIVKHNVSAITSGNYTFPNINIDSYGHITSASSNVKSKLSELSSASLLNLSDITYIVSNPSGCPISYSATLQLIKDTISSGSGSGGTGDVIHMGGSTNGHLAVFYGTSGSVITDGGAVPTSGSGGGIGADGWAEADAITYSSADAPSYVVTCTGDQSGKYYPGMRIKLTDSTVKYFIITKVAYTSSTAITLYGGSDYTLSGSEISNPYYSSAKAPAGFPLNPVKWMVTATDGSSRTQASPTQNAWYNLGSLSITIPIGVWIADYYVSIASYKSAATTHGVTTALSTANNSASDSTLISYITQGNFTIGGGVATAKSYLVLTAKTVYYLNTRTVVASMDNIYNNNDQVEAIIRAVNAYL